MLTDHELLLYHRQIILNEMGPRGQEKLKNARIGVVGLGGLGSSAALYLAVAGIGNLVLIDDDDVSLSNLQRQILHGRPDLHQPKTESAAACLTHRNPEVKLELHSRRLNAENGEAMLAGTDFVIDATDNAAAKFLIAEICHKLKIPYSHAGVKAFQGQLTTVIPDSTACCRCLFTQSPEQLNPAGCQDSGIIGAIPGIIGSLQALEAIKFMITAGQLLTNRLLVFDGLTAGFREIRFQRNPACPLCHS